MNALPFDTRVVEKPLVEKGFTPEQADVLIEVASESARDALATKADIEALRSDVQKIETDLCSDMKALESRLSGDMKELESRLSGDMKALESRLGGEMKALESKVTSDMQAVKSELQLEIARLQTRTVFMMLAVVGFANTLLFFALRATA